MMHKLTIHTLLVVLGVTVFYFPAHAQLNTSESRAPRIDVSVAHPKPGEEVTAEIVNYQPDTDAYDLRWYVNGSSESIYTNQREITIQVPALGQQVILEARRNEEVVASRTITPVYIDIITEPDTYVPIRFPGRPAPTPNSFVTFTAIVEEAQALPATSYRYEWKKNGNSAKGEYVTGSQITIPIENRKEHTISVRIFHPDRGLVGEEFIQIPVVDPLVNIYEIHALYGMMNDALEKNKQINTNQIQLRAIPYYYDNEILRNNPEITWQVDNNIAQTGSSRISLEKIRENGSSRLEFSLRGAHVMDQRVRETLNLQY